MKTNLYMMLLVLAVGSVANVEAGGYKKSETSSCHTCSTKSKVDARPLFKDEMHDIQRCIDDVRENTRTNSQAVSQDKLNVIQARIDALEVKPRNHDEENLNMHDTHIRTLRRELKNARTHVSKHGM